MKAVVARQYGGPDVLELVDRPEPALGPRDVLIAVKAASLNPIDVRSASAAFAELERGRARGKIVVTM
jgi:NADPH2:quinone reductase